MPSPESTTVAAIDLGATSGRVVAVTLAGDKLDHEVVHRFPNGPRQHSDGSLRWDFENLMQEIRKGLDLLMTRSRIDSIGVDAWGVDYGLLRRDGSLVAPPFSYRDRRTEGWREILNRIGEKRVYEITGIQMMPINTLIQLAAHDKAERDAAAHFLMIPELVIHDLTGEIVGEHTSASTSQLYDASSRDWSDELLEVAGVKRSMMPGLLRSPEQAGSYREVPIHLVGHHDTASAVAALPVTGDGFAAFLSSGTWSLVGVELDEPHLTEEARLANFTNEAGVFGNVRFLRNVIGMWMIDECTRKWGISVEEVTELAMHAAPGASIDAMDERFLNPEDMESEIRAAAGGLLPDGRGAVIRCVVESLAQAYAIVIDRIESVMGRRPDHLHIIGGGSRFKLLNDLTAERCRLPVFAGPVEATSLGNALVQLIALGAVPNLAAGRKLIAAS